MTTPAQRNYLLDLAAKRDAPKLGATPDERRAEMARLLGEHDLTTREASAWIDRLKSYALADVTPVTVTRSTQNERPATPFDTIPDMTADRAANDPPNRLRPNDSGINVRPLGEAGSNGKARFAITDDTDNTLKFVIVRAVTNPDSQWDGWTFVDVQAGPQTYPLGRQRTSGSYYGKSLDLVRKLAALDADDLAEAMARYGRELGYCGKCGSELTDETSRARGIGPYCEGRTGQSKPRNPDWPTMNELVAGVRAHARANYERDGWDVIEECHDDDQLREWIGPRVRTVAGAIRKVMTESGIKLYDEKRRDIQATAF